MAPALAVLFGAAFTVSSAVALGNLLLRRCPLRAQERFVLAFVAGGAALSTLVFALCCLRAARPSVFLCTGAALIVAALCLRTVPQGRLPSMTLWPGLAAGAVLAAYGALYLVHAMAPERSPDGSTYHLGLVARYLREGGFASVPPSMYAGFPAGTEMLFLFAFAFGRHSAAALVHLAFLAALAGLLICYGRRTGAPAAGAWSAVLVAASPVMGIDGTSAYVDVALACASFATFYVVEIWREEGGEWLPALAGLLAGFALAIKYTGAVVCLYAFVVVAYRSRRAAPLFRLVLSASVVAAPWLLKNWLQLGNPFSPFLNAVFPNPFIHISMEHDIARMVTNLEWWGLKSAWQLPAAAAVTGELRGVAGPVFLLAPVAFLAWRRGLVRRALAVALLFGAYFAYCPDLRYLIPSLPFLSVAMAGAPAVGAPLALAHAVLSWPSIVPRYAAPDIWRLDGFPWRAALRLTPEETYLREQCPECVVARLVEESTPVGARILMLGGIADAYTTRELLAAFHPAEGELAADLLHAATSPAEGPLRELRFTFPAQAIRALRVTQTARTRDTLWSVYEVRLSRASHELPRASSWRLRARPNPWDARMAFDNSPVTRWRTWEAAGPGMFLQVDFASPQLVDTVAIETSPGQEETRLRIEGESGRGEWRVLSADPHSTEIAPRAGLRRAAARELLARGIGYLLVGDGDNLADDIRVRAPAWGAEMVVETRRTRLYRLRQE